MAFGVVMVYSASVHTATYKKGNGSFYLIRDLVYVLTGLTVMFVAARTPLSILHKLVPFIVLSAVLAMMLVPAFGHTAGRSKRWFNFGLMMFQPSEFAKLALVIYMAYIAHSKANDIHSFFRGYLPPFFLAGILMITAMMQPDFGSAIIFGVLVVTMLFVAGTRVAYVALTFLIAIPAALHLILHNSMRWARFTAFLDPWSHRYGTGYQTVNSLAAMANGGATGVGLGGGEQKVGYIPEAQTDFIVSVIGEEIGLIGTLLLLTLYAVIIVRGILAARQAPDTFCQALGFGIVLLVSLQVLINVGVAYGMLPTKGLTLPLVSYGGTSMAVTSVSVGILLQLSRGNDDAPIPTKRKRKSATARGAVPLDFAAGGLG